jgi:lysophospholipase L1-like esterase
MQEITRKTSNDENYYLDLSSAFLAVDGTLYEKIFPDYLHPSEKGYKIWAEAMEPVIAELLGESVIKETL